MRRQGLLIAAAVAAVGLIGAAAALAGNGIQIISKDRPNRDTEQAVRPVARCPQNYHVLGGGFSDFNAAGLAQRNKPIGDHGWRVAFLTFLANGGNATAYALCEPARLRKIEVVHKQVQIPAGGGGPGANGEAGVTARCPSGMEALSGGYSVRPRFKATPPPQKRGGTAPQGEVSIDTSRRSGARGWFVHAGNDGARTALAAFAVCQPQKASTVTQVSQTNEATNGPFVEADAACPEGSHVVGGGFKFVPNERNGGFPTVNGSFPGDPGTWVATWGGESAKRGDSWNKRGIIQVPALTSYAECES